MQYLAVFLLVGLGLASAYTSDFDDGLSIDSEQLGPVMDRLKESFERIVNKIKERFDGGGGINGGLMKKAQDLFNKLKSKKFPLSDKIRSIFEDLKSKMGRNR
ncbi:hypothetical protein AVEN_207878-1 [Araneus ventricosus]|uniref:Uncharacterized protein n=1 Tax=Araneus ventricosus TaxID=182803 RepID=A0A4Y2T4V4_ARAVE|nr:hypothetical protein AVEN_207878-1 [Araneus ventricosus]